MKANHTDHLREIELFRVCQQLSSILKLSRKEYRQVLALLGAQTLSEAQAWKWEQDWGTL